MTHTLSENLGYLRLIRGYSLREVAKKLECSPNALANWEKGTVSPPADMVMKLCQIYNVSASQIFGEEPCNEITNFVFENSAIIDEIKRLQEQKTDIEFKLKYYTNKLSQRV